MAEDAAKRDGPTFLVIKDLAERWGVSVEEAKKIVRKEKVPFISLRTIDVNIRWSYIRFNPQAISAWEDDRLRVVDEPLAPVRETVVMRRLR